jgi:hypothetical protein
LPIGVKFLAILPIYNLEMPQVICGFGNTADWFFRLTIARMRLYELPTAGAEF